MSTVCPVADLLFSYLSGHDLKDLVDMLAKPSVCEQVYFGPNAEDDTRAYFEPLIRSITDAINKNSLPRDHVFAIRKDGNFVGNCALIAQPYTAGHYTIGYTIDDQYWRQRYGNQACRFLVHYGFNQLSAYRLSADCMGNNAGSRRILEKNGFRLEGCQKNYWFKNGSYQDNLLYGLLRPS